MSLERSRTVSVLVEALSVVVPRKVLDVSYPGGTDAYVARVCCEDYPSRFGILDDRLTVTSFYTPADVAAHLAHLAEFGIVHVDEEEMETVEAAVVEQKFGPLMPTSWLEFRHTEDGFSYVWPAGEDAGDMAVPGGWTPEASRGLLRIDTRKDNPDFLNMGLDNKGLEHWLDLSTGEETVGLPQPVEHVLPELILTRLAAIDASLDEDEMEFAPTDQNVREGFITGEHLVYRCRYLVDLVQDLVAVLLWFPVFASGEWARIQMSEAVARANFGLRWGNFDLDVDGGAICFRLQVHAAAGFEAATASMMRATAVITSERYAPAFMSVIFADADPAAAIREAESGDEGEETEVDAAEHENEDDPPGSTERRGDLFD